MSGPRPAAAFQPPLTPVSVVTVLDPHGDERRSYAIRGGVQEAFAKVAEQVRSLVATGASCWPAGTYQLVAGDGTKQNFRAKRGARR